MPLSQVSSQKGESFDDVTLQAENHCKNANLRAAAAGARAEPERQYRIRIPMLYTLRRTCALLRFGTPSAKMPKKTSTNFDRHTLTKNNRVNVCLLVHLCELKKSQPH
jgi:hypothetical protein